MSQTEQRGFKVVIPARFASTRLPGKPLADIAGRPLIAHVCDRAMESGADEVIVATDDERIAEAVAPLNIAVAITRTDHESGTDRIGEVAAQQGWSGETIVVNVQGDEPLMPPEAIRQVGSALAQTAAADIATLCTAITETEDLTNPNVVRVVRDINDFALYFSRAPIPFSRDAGGANAALSARHIGIYGYRVSMLEKLCRLPAADIELSESLEQLRALWHGMRLIVPTAQAVPGPGVDTPEDLERVRAVFRSAGS